MEFRVVMGRIVRDKNFNAIRSLKAVEVSSRTSYVACNRAFSQETSPGWKIVHLFRKKSEKWDKIF